MLSAGEIAHPWSSKKRSYITALKYGLYFVLFGSGVLFFVPSRMFRLIGSPIRSVCRKALKDACVEALVAAFDS